MVRISSDPSFTILQLHQLLRRNEAVKNIYLQLMGKHEEGRQTQKEPQFTEDSRLQQVKTFSKEEPIEGDIERTISLQQKKRAGSTDETRSSPKTQKKPELTTDRKPFKDKRVEKEELKGGDTQANRNILSTESVISVDRDRPSDANECCEGTDSPETQTQKGTQCTEDRKPLQEKTITKEEFKEGDIATSISCQQTKPAESIDEARPSDFNQHLLGRDSPKTQKRPEGTTDRKPFKDKRVEKEELKGGDTEANSNILSAKSVKSVDRDTPSDANECCEGTDSPKAQEKPDITADRIPFKDKRVVNEELKGGGTQTNPSFQRTLLVEPIDGGKPIDSSKPVKDTSQNVKEETQADFKTPKAHLKIGWQRQVSKKGAKKHHFTEAGKLIHLVFGLITFTSIFGRGSAAPVPQPKIPYATTPRMTETLPPACTDDGNEPGWLNRNDVGGMINGRVFNGSYRRYTNICPNAFDGLKIREIILTGNSLTTLPEGLFRNVIGLHRLFIDNNRFTSFPVALNECTDIESLDISYNDIKEIPRGSINNAISLHRLDASGNENLNQYPEDVFYLPKISSVSLGNTAISSPPFPPPFRLKSEKYLVILERETGEVLFDLQNTTALSSEIVKVKIWGSPEGRVAHIYWRNYTFGFEVVENRSNATQPQTDVSASLPTPGDMTTLNNSLVNSNITANYNATQPQNDVSASPPTPADDMTTLNNSLVNSNITANCNAAQQQNDVSTSVLLILEIIFWICMIYLKAKDIKNGPMHRMRVGLFVLAVAVKIAEFIVALTVFGIGVTLVVVAGALVAPIPVLVDSCVSKKNNAPSDFMVYYDRPPQSVFVQGTNSGPEGNVHNNE